MVVVKDAGFVNTENILLLFLYGNVLYGSYTLAGAVTGHIFPWGVAINTLWSIMILYSYMGSHQKAVLQVGVSIQVIVAIIVNLLEVV